MSVTACSRQSWVTFDCPVFGTRSQYEVSSRISQPDSDIVALGMEAFMIRHALLLVVLAPLLGALVPGGSEAQSDPLTQLTATFPKSVQFKNRGKVRVLEFCPDNTCHGFSASYRVPKATLRDFAFLYIYYYSDYYALPEWRAKEQVKHTAELVLSRPQYRSCKRGNDRESARCVLLDLSRRAGIKLLFIRYDEGQRNASEEDLLEQLGGDSPPKGTGPQ
jgi:hypothetical protein